MSSSPMIRRGTMLLTVLIIALYVAAYAAMIHRQHAVAYWDQTNYLSKTYRMADRLYTPLRPGHTFSDLVHRYDPLAPISIGPANRPPLLMYLPAGIGGPAMSPHFIAYAWLLQRTLFYVLGLSVFCRITRSNAWLPIATAATLGTSFFLSLNQNLYMMDLPFASMAFLAVSLICWAAQSRKTSHAFLAALAVLAAFLIKPQALLFLFPFVATYGIERVIHQFLASRRFRKCPATFKKPDSKAFVFWVAVNAFLLMAIVFLLFSRYGEGVRQQYAWGQEGYWSLSLTFDLFHSISIGLLPPYLLFLAVISILFLLVSRERRRQRPFHSGNVRLFILLSVGCLSWCVFNLFLTYTIDARIAWSLMPVMVFAASLLIGTNRFLAALGILSAVGVFGASVLVATGAGESFLGRSTRLFAGVFGPRVGWQMGIPEVGETEIVKTVTKNISERSPSTLGSNKVTVAFCHEYLEYAGLNLVARWQNGHRWSPILFDQFPFGDRGFAVMDEFDPNRSSWFLTYQGPAPRSVSERALVNMYAIDTLITDTSSPIHGAFTRLQSMPVRVPLVAETPPTPSSDEYTIADGTVTLWHLDRRLTPAECLKATRFILPRYRNGAGEGMMETQAAELEAVGNATSAVHRVTTAEIPTGGMLAGNVEFDGGLILHAVIADTQGANQQFDLYWEATKNVDLNNNRFFHLLDVAGTIVHQADAPQDPLSGSVKAGTLWRDRVIVPASWLNPVTKVALGIQSPTNQIQMVTVRPPQAGVRTDWDGHRLLLDWPSHK